MEQKLGSLLSSRFSLAGERILKKNHFIFIANLYLPGHFTLTNRQYRKCHIVSISDKRYPPSGGKYFLWSDCIQKLTGSKRYFLWSVCTCKFQIHCDTSRDKCLSNLITDYRNTLNGLHSSSDGRSLSNLFV